MSKNKNNFVKYFFLLLALILITSAGFLTIGSGPRKKIDLPDFTPVKGKFLQNNNLHEFPETETLACVHSFDEFKQIIEKNADRILTSGVPLSNYKDKGFSNNEFWNEYDEYYSFTPVDNGNMLRCDYFKDVSLIKKLEKNTLYLIGYFKQEITRDSFDKLVTFLIKAHFVPQVIINGFNVATNSYHSTITETAEKLIRTDISSYTVHSDTSSDSSTSKIQFTYSIIKASGAVFFEPTQSTPFYPFPYP